MSAAMLMREACKEGPRGSVSVKSRVAKAAALLQAPQQKLPVSVKQLPSDTTLPASALYLALFIWTTAQVQIFPHASIPDNCVASSRAVCTHVPRRHK